MKIRSNAKVILLENYEQCPQEITFLEYVKREAESDPNFFRWLFHEDLKQDFVCPDKEAFENFLHQCEVKFEVLVSFDGSDGWQTICYCDTTADAEAEIEHQKHIEDNGDCEYCIRVA